MIVQKSLSEKKIFRNKNLVNGKLASVQTMRQTPFDSAFKTSLIVSDACIEKPYKAKKFDNSLYFKIFRIDFWFRLIASFTAFN